MLGVRALRPADALQRTVQPLRFQFHLRLGPPPSPLQAARAVPAQAQPAGVLRLDGAVQFHSDRIGVAGVSRGTVRMAGTGRLNGRPGYRFVAEASDGEQLLPQGRDRLRVRISHADPRTGTEVIDYDNAAPARNVRAAISSGARVGAAPTFNERATAVQGSITLRR